MPRYGTTPRSGLLPSAAKTESKKRTCTIASALAQMHTIALTRYSRAARRCGSWRPCSCRKRRWRMPACWMRVRRNARWRQHACQSAAGSFGTRACTCCANSSSNWEEALRAHSCFPLFGGVPAWVTRPQAGPVPPRLLFRSLLAGRLRILQARFSPGSMESYAERFGVVGRERQVLNT